MKKNTSTIDRIIRIAVAVVILILFMSNIITGAVAYVLLGMALIFVITGLVGVCPLYAIFGISSYKRSNTTGA